METGTLIYVLLQSDIPRAENRPAGLLASVADIRKACGSVGLETFVPRGITQLSSAENAVKQMGAS